MKTTALFASWLVVAACGGASDPGDENGSAGSGGSGAIGSGGSSGSKATGGTGTGGTRAAGGSAGTSSQAGRGGAGGGAGKSGAGGSAGESGSAGVGGASGSAGDGGAPGATECPPQRPEAGTSCDQDSTCRYHWRSGCYCVDSACTTVSPDCEPGAGGTGAGDRAPIAGTSGIVAPTPIDCSCPDGTWVCIASTTS